MSDYRRHDSRDYGAAQWVNVDDMVKVECPWCGQTVPQNPEGYLVAHYNMKQTRLCAGSARRPEEWGAHAKS